MAHQQHPEIPVNENTLKAPTNHAFFPTTNLYHFYKDANINFQLNRFLIPGLEEMVVEFGLNTGYVKSETIKTAVINLSN